MTPEKHPLELFGADASATVARALDAAGIEFISVQRANVSAGAVRLPGHSRGSLSADRIVSLPLVRGPRLPGVPSTGLYGLIPVDPYGRVEGLPDAYAVGDATDFPLKQGGIACQQADAVAANIAARHGADVAPTRFRPVLRATLLTGHGPPIALGAAPRGYIPQSCPVDTSRRTCGPMTGGRAAGHRVTAAGELGSNEDRSPRSSPASMLKHAKHCGSKRGPWSGSPVRSGSMAN